VPSPNRSPSSSSTFQSFSTCSKAALASTLALVRAYLRPGVSLRRVPAHLSLPVKSVWRNLCVVLTYMFLTLAGGACGCVDKMAVQIVSVPGVLTPLAYCQEALSIARCWRMRSSV
jgi:hypothetical protein